MRLSKFNEIIKCGDEYLLYNLYSGAILVLDEHYKERYEQIKNNIITMEDGQKIQISRMKAKKFHEKFSDYMGVKYRREK